MDGDAAAGAVEAGLAACVTVSSGVAWYPYNETMPLRIRFFWFVALPLLTAIFGYFPARRAAAA